MVQDKCEAEVAPEVKFSWFKVNVSVFSFACAF